MRYVGAKRILTSVLATVTAAVCTVGMVPTAMCAESSKTEPTTVQPVKPVKPVKTVTGSKIIKPNRIVAAIKFQIKVKPVSLLYLICHTLRKI